MKRELGHPLYWLARGLLKLMALIWLRFESHHSERVPHSGGCILTPNHASFLDPPLVGGGIRHRVVHFMARDTLFRIPLMGWAYRKIGTIAIDRTKGDLAALRSAIQILKSGKVVCLFPEGTRTLTGELQEPKGGVGFLIAKAGVPVVPVYLDGTYRAWPKGAKWIRPVKVRIFYGEPIQPEEFGISEKGKTDYDQVVQLVMRRIADLKAEAEALHTSS